MSKIKNLNISLSLNNKQKYKAWFFHLEQGKFRRIKKKKFNPLKNKGMIHYKGKSFDVDLDNLAFTYKQSTVYFFNFQTKEQIGTKEKENTSQDSAVKDLLFIQEIMYQGFKAIREKSITINWIHLLLVGGLTLVIGWILGTYIPVGAIF